jgi:serine/threonine-protein kinase SRPK3
MTLQLPPNSLTMLVRDEQKYLAAKFLSLDATEQHRSGVMCEREFLKAIQQCDDIINLPVLVDDFEVEGTHGSHLCFVMNLMSSDVSSFRRSSPNKALKPYIVKNIISHVLEALIQLHSLGIIHTGAWFAMNDLEAL